MPGMSIEEALLRHSEQLMELPGVVGTAQGELGGKPCILVLVAKKTAVSTNAIPLALDGYPVAIVETGEIKASTAE